MYKYHETCNIATFNATDFTELYNNFLTKKGRCSNVEAISNVGRLWNAEFKVFV